jgi:hypothetical protein
MRSDDADRRVSWPLALEPQDEVSTPANLDRRTARPGDWPTEPVSSAAYGTPVRAPERRRAWLLPALLVLCAGLGFAGWHYADPLKAAIGLSPYRDRGASEGRCERCSN